MALSYDKNDTNSTILIGHKYTFVKPIYTFTNTRGFLRFDLSGQPFGVGDIVSVKLKIRVTSQISTDSYQLWSGSTGDNWGTALSADAVDWGSTRVSLEDTIAISGIGNYEFDIDKNNFILTGFTHFIVRSTTENQQNYKTINIASQTHGTASYRPSLEIVYNS